MKLSQKDTQYPAPAANGKRRLNSRKQPAETLSFVPAHYHITEVGKVQRDFIDCGGTVRSTKACVLQVWVANDVDHHLETTKLASIMAIAAPLLGSEHLSVEVEYEEGVISQYPIGGVEVTPSGPLFYLGTKHTASLAPEKCKVGDTGCC